MYLWARKQILVFSKILNCCFEENWFLLSAITFHSSSRIRNPSNDIYLSRSRSLKRRWCRRQFHVFDKPTCSDVLQMSAPPTAAAVLEIWRGKYSLVPFTQASFLNQPASTAQSWRTLHVLLCLQPLPSSRPPTSTENITELYLNRSSLFSLQVPSSPKTHPGQRLLCMKMSDILKSGATGES